MCKLRALRVHFSSISDASLASLPPSLVLLDVSHCARLTLAATLPSLPALQVLNATGTSVGDSFMASLPLSLTELRINNCANVTSAADVGRLTALRKLQASVTTDLPPSDLAALHARGCFVKVEAAPQVASPFNADSMAVLREGAARRDRGVALQLMISGLLPVPARAGAYATV